MNSGRGSRRDASSRVKNGNKFGHRKKELRASKAGGPKKRLNMNNLTRLVRCNKQSPCPICGKPDWCSLAEDGSFAICMRQADGAHKPTKNGGWLHVLRRHAGGALPRAMRHSEVINLPCVIDIGINGQIDGQIESIELFSQDFTEKSPRIDGHFDCKIDGKKQMSIYHHKKRNNFIISICQ